MASSWSDRPNNDPVRQPFAPKSEFDATLALIQAGDPAAAETRARAALASWPRDVNMQGLLGALLIKLDRPDEAEQLLMRVIAEAPSFAKPHEDLGMLLLQQQRPEQAARYLEKATRLDPKLEQAWFTLGKTYALLGRGAEADAAFEKCFELSPERKMMAHAAEHQRDGKLEEAERLYRRVLRHNPDNVDALRLLAMLSLHAQREAEAESLLLKAVAGAPDFLAAWLDLGKLRNDLDRFAEALECFDRVLAVEPRNVQALFLKAQSLAHASFTHEAIDMYRHCLAVRPDHIGALLGLGHVLKTVGQYLPAVDSYAECIRQRPEFGETYWSLANLKTYRFDDTALAEMQRRVATGGLTVSSEVNFRFAIAKALEDRGDFDRAWEYYASGNQLQRTEVSYDPVQTEVVNDRLIETYSADFLQAHQGAGNADEAPIFIVGLPRSGSTLLEQILASHSAVEGTSELPYVGRLTTWLNRNRAEGINYPEAMRELGARHFEQLGTDYLKLARLHRRRGSPRFIDKMPNNFPSIGFLALILPNAKVIDARRHPLDATMSCFRQLFAKGQAFTYDQTEIGEYYLQYQRMMDHWAQVLPGKVLTVQYEKVVADLEGQTRRMLDFCGLPFEETCLRFHESDRPVRTPSSEQVRQPIYDKSIGQWRRYERHIDELLTVLAPLRARYAAFEGGR
jgi:tetratricopeptide (TPR) repeat protein